MNAASRVRLAPLAALGEDALLHAARGLVAPKVPVRPGDAVGESLVVLAVDPEPGAMLADETEVELVPSPRTREAAAVEVAILLDVSESMGQPWDGKHSRLSAALAALTSFAKKAPRSVESVSVYEYAKHTRLVAGPAKPQDLGVIPAPTPKGRSHDGQALDAALATLAGRTRPGVSQAIVLLTDGVGDVADLLLAAERAARLHVPIHAVVFAPEVDSAFDAMSGLAGGAVHQAAYPLTIPFTHPPGG